MKQYHTVEKRGQETGKRGHCVLQLHVIILYQRTLAQHMTPHLFQAPTPDTVDEMLGEDESLANFGVEC